MVVEPALVHVEQAQRAGDGVGVEPAGVLHLGENRARGAAAGWRRAACPRERRAKLVRARLVDGHRPGARASGARCGSGPPRRSSRA